ncbi:MAG: hypothetical protein HY941_02350 [Gammaproteobacteria bacterium]|nr:hypothetical protein [Gammaproteobacteria bacterium]
MEEDEYRSTYKTFNERRCVLEKALNTRKVACSHAERFFLADREGVGCKTDPAQRRCQDLLTRMRDSARFVLQMTHIGGPLPHNKEIKVQVGGLLGIQAQIYPERAACDEIGDVFSLLNDAELRFGGAAEFPYQDIVKLIARYQNRTRRGER